MIHDVLIIFGASGAAGVSSKHVHVYQLYLTLTCLQVLTVAARKFGWEHVSTWRCSIAFGACSILLALRSMLRTLQSCNRELFTNSFDDRGTEDHNRWSAERTKQADENKSWHQSSRAGSTRSRHVGSLHTTRAGQQLDSNSIALSRPMSDSETTAQWSGVSGPMTLPRPDVLSVEAQAASVYSNEQSNHLVQDGCQRCREGVVLYQMQSVNGHAAFLPLSCEQMSSFS